MGLLKSLTKDHYKVIMLHQYDSTLTMCTSQGYTHMHFFFSVYKQWNGYAIIYQGTYDFLLLNNIYVATSSNVIKGVAKTQTMHIFKQ